MTAKSAAACQAFDQNPASSPMRYPPLGIFSWL